MSRAAGTIRWGRRDRVPILVRFSVLLCIGVAAGCGGEAPFPEALEPAPAARFIVSQNAAFGALEPAARTIVAAEALHTQTHHFCVIGYELDDGQPLAWVHWMETQRLILWDGSSDPEFREKGLLYSRRDLRRDTDTVDTAADIAGSTYLETRAWWDAVVQDCEAHGEKLLLAPFELE